MKCPACGNDLTEKEGGNVTVDVCEGGCGGVWFDLFELQKVDEKQEAAGEEILHIKRDNSIKVDPKARRMCPRCYGTMMMSHFFSVKLKVLVDECPKCGGYWLDFGELAGIRAIYATEEERHEAAKTYFEALTSEKFQIMHSHSREIVEKRRRIANMLRFLCPSYYLSGDQRWGAF